MPLPRPPVHMLSRMQDNNPNTKREMWSSKRWTQLEYKGKEVLFKVIQSLVPEGSCVPKQAIEEPEPGKMSLQPGILPTAQLTQKESLIKTCWAKLYMLIS